LESVGLLSEAQRRGRKDRDGAGCEIGLHQRFPAWPA
jgi:hypothetical protein